MRCLSIGECRMPISLWFVCVFQWQVRFYLLSLRQWCNGCRGVGEPMICSGVCQFCLSLENFLRVGASTSRLRICFPYLVSFFCVSFSLVFFAHLSLCCPGSSEGISLCVYVERSVPIAPRFSCLVVPVSHRLSPAVFCIGRLLSSLFVSSMLSQRCSVLLERDSLGLPMNLSSKPGERGGECASRKVSRRRVGSPENGGSEKTWIRWRYLLPDSLVPRRSLISFVHMIQCQKSQI